MRLSCVCMHKKCFFQIRSIEKPVTFFKNGHKKLFSLQNAMKNLFEMHYSLEKNCLQVPKMVTPPNKKLMVPILVPTFPLNNKGEMIKRAIKIPDLL